MAVRPSRPATARACALDLLARREHSTAELRAKLASREFDAEEIDSTLARLSAEGLVSDERFVEAFVSAHRRRGQGPHRIRAELRQKGVATELAEQHLAASVTDWTELARQVRVRRFGATPPRDFRERAKQARFLQMRGFSADAIHGALKGDE